MGKKINLQRKKNLQINEKWHMYIKRGFFIILIMVAALLQNTPHLLPSIYGARPFLLIPVVVCISIFEKNISTAFFGLFAGVLWDTAMAVGDGFNTLVLMLISAVSGVLLYYLMRNNMVTALLLTSGSLLFYCVLHWLIFLLFRGIQGSAIMFLTFYLPSMLYSILFMPVIYFGIRAFNKKLRDTRPVTQKINRL
ncbi:MAG: rod shape-determining protein MreD [Oscillospiraceae bacterium]|jgi:rod shape-determining protein MreD|nr:rod shape-determining protein MreD [Oscillospiraceae bacterium]